MEEIKLPELISDLPTSSRSFAVAGSRWIRRKNRPLQSRPKQRPTRKREVRNHVGKEKSSRRSRCGSNSPFFPPSTAGELTGKLKGMKKLNEDEEREGEKRSCLMMMLMMRASVGAAAPWVTGD